MNLLSFENEKFATLFSIVQGEKENEKMHSFHKRDKSNYKINSTKQCPRSTQNDGIHKITKTKEKNSKEPKG